MLTIVVLLVSFESVLSFLPALKGRRPWVWSGAALADYFALGRAFNYTDNSATRL